MTAVDRTDNNLERFRYNAPAWWAAFERGRREAREQARMESADWRAGDWQRGAASRINEGELT